LFITVVISKNDLLSDIRGDLFVVLRYCHNKDMSDFADDSDEMQRHVRTHFLKRTIDDPQFDSGWDLSCTDCFVVSFGCTVFVHLIGNALVLMHTHVFNGERIRLGNFALFATTKGIFRVSISCQMLQMLFNDRSNSDSLED
jgi:hypothetical protein